MEDIKVPTLAKKKSIPEIKPVVKNQRAKKG